MGERVERPKRRFWQVHLSTLVVLALIIGGISGLNFTQQHRIRRAMPANPDIEIVHVGWPLPVLEWDITYASEHEQPYMSSSVFNGFCDFLIGIGIAGFAAIASEYLIRRREVKP